jgi:glycine cleavage system H protein
MDIKDNLHYSESHEWARLDGSDVLVGITDYAQEELGDVVYVELPEVGNKVGAGEECGMIDSAKTTSPLNSPIGGTVVRVNDELADHPELVNKSPYDEGWMFALEPDNPDDMNKLMSADEYRKFAEEEG